MRTTLDIADDVLYAVKERARREKRSAGDVLSDLARQALLRGSVPADGGEEARAWLEREIPKGWASCPSTEKGFVRIVSQPRYPSPDPPAEAIRRLALATRAGQHELWP